MITTNPLASALYAILSQDGTAMIVTMISANFTFMTTKSGTSA
jgi:hypothetical protein